MLAALEVGGNASSVHARGPRRAQASRRCARDDRPRARRALPRMVVFTSGGSEANNLALKGAPVERLLVSAIEHPSVHRSREGERQAGRNHSRRRRRRGRSRRAWQAACRGPRRWSASCSPTTRRASSSRCARSWRSPRRHGALVHTDAVQALGKIPVNFGLLGVDLLTVSAHKLGGPLGCGALIVRDGLSLRAADPWRRPGTAPPRRHRERRRRLPVLPPRLQEKTHEYQSVARPS